MKTERILKTIKFISWFAFIGLMIKTGGTSTILIKIISALIMSNIMQQIIPDLGNSLIIYLGIIFSAFDLTSVFLIIIGLFFMMFSKSFENAKKLQLENDLTI